MYKILAFKKFFFLNTSNPPKNIKYNYFIRSLDDKIELA